GEIFAIQNRGLRSFRHFQHQGVVIIQPVHISIRRVADGLADDSSPAAAIFDLRIIPGPDGDWPLVAFCNCSADSYLHLTIELVFARWNFAEDKVAVGI